MIIVQIQAIQSQQEPIFLQSTAQFNFFNYVYNTPVFFPAARRPAPGTFKVGELIVGML